MKEKNNKGITLISLVITVIIMILLASITAYEANDLVAVARVESVTTDLLLIQAKVRIINEQIVFDDSEENIEKVIKGTKISLDENSGTLKTMKSKGIITDSDNIEKIYILSQDDLRDMGLDTLDATDGYVVNYETEEVIYVKGVKNENKDYLYKLSDMSPQS